MARLTSTVDDLGYGGWDSRYGAGRVNAFRAVGGSVAAPSLPARDGLEGNNSLGDGAPHHARRDDATVHLPGR